MVWGLARSAASRYNVPAPGGEGDTGAAAMHGRVSTRHRGILVFDIEGKRVALYARHSKAAQARSVPAQLHRLREAARTHGASVAAEYADKGITGAVLLSRPAAQDLLAHAAAAEFQAVLIEDLSRISRDQADVATIHKVLEFHEVPLFSVTEGEIGVLHICLQGTMNALYLKQLSDKVRRGQLAAVRNGHIPGGHIYGYSLHRPEGTQTSGRRRIEEKEAAVVRRIFDEAEQGKPFRRIAADLNRDGIPSPMGKKWAANTVIGDRLRGRGLLRQTLYIGRIVFGRYRVIRHPITGRRVQRPQPRSEWLVTEAPDLAIISKEQWDRVQRSISQPDPSRPAPRQRPAIRPNTPPRYLTTRRTFCASCGGRITTAHSGYLVCRSWKEHRACDQRHLFRREQIIEATLEYLASPRCESDIRTSFEELVRNAETAVATTHMAIKTATDLVTRARAEADTIPGTITNTVGMAPVREQIALTIADFKTLCDSLQRLRLAATGTLSAINSHSIATAAHTIIAAAAERIRGDTAIPGDEAVLEQMVETIHVAFRGPGRQGLEVTPAMASQAAYRLGLADVAPALLRDPPRRRHRTASPAGRSPA